MKGGGPKTYDIFAKFVDFIVLESARDRLRYYMIKFVQIFIFHAFLQFLSLESPRATIQE